MNPQGHCFVFDNKQNILVGACIPGCSEASAGETDVFTNQPSIGAEEKKDARSFGTTLYEIIFQGCC